jgi:hypothetical protein
MQTRQIGFVEIQRKRGRIAGFGSPRFPVDTLWCGVNRPRKKAGRRQNGWSFPPAVREQLLHELEGKTCVHFFGGNADFGIRMDLDAVTNPHVVADAFLPPFPRDSFDAVILDPPYYNMRREENIALLHAAAWVAREHVYWFHTVWIGGNHVVKCDRAWLIRVGDQCAIRTLQRFKVLEPKFKPLAPGEFKRGECLKYNRWSQAAVGLPFPDLPAGKQIASRAPASKVFVGDWQR